MCTICPKTGYWGNGFEIAKYRSKEECEKDHVRQSFNQLNDRIKKIQKTSKV